MKNKRRLSLMCAVLLLLTAFFAVPVPVAQAASGMLRVYLKSMEYNGSFTSKSLTLNGTYSIPSASGLVLQSRGTYDLSMYGDGIYITGPGIAAPVNLGNDFMIKQHANSDNGIGTISMYNAKYGTLSYRGDMRVDVSGGGLRFINTVFVEDYLYGVLAGELSNLFPLETLKAQAVIARSYIYNRMLKSEPNYEINDTSSDQVYKGYNSANNNIIKAVDATAGVLLKYGSSYVNAYFGASNGGQIELPGNAWSSSSSLGCYVMRDDPYDVRNPSSKSSTYTITADLRSVDASFIALLQQKVSYQTGIYPSTMYINSMTLTDPVQTDGRSQGISRNYQTMNVTLTVADMNGVTQQINISLSLHNEIKYSLFSDNTDLRLFSLQQSGEMYYLTLARWGHGVGMSQRGAQQMANEGVSYRDIINYYFDGVSMPEIAFSRDPLVPHNPIDATPIGTGEITTSSLSVRKSPSTSDSKLGTLTRGASVTVYQNLGDWYAIGYNGGYGYVSAAYLQFTPNGQNPDVTPIPSPGGDVALYQARISLSTASSTLKLRSSGSSTGSVVTTMPHGSIVTVLSNSGEWHKVRLAAGVTGYASGAYLIKIDGSDTTFTPTPTNTVTTIPTPTDAVYAIGKVTASSLNVRSGPSNSASKLGSVTKNQILSIFAQNSGFYKITYGTGLGYVSAQYVTVTDQVTTPPTATVAPTATPIPTFPPIGGTPTQTYFPGMDSIGKTAYVVSSSVAVPMFDKVGGGVIEFLNAGTQVIVRDFAGEYTMVRTSGGREGYVYYESLRVGDGFQPSATPVPTQSQTPGGQTQQGTIRLSSSSSSLNMRAAASTNSSVVTSMKHGTSITITGTSGDWYAITANGYNGYVMKSYVHIGTTDSGDDNSDAGTTPVYKGTIRLSAGSGNVNVRSGPGTNNEVLGSLSHGFSVNVLFQNGDWYKIEYGNGNGYVLKSYVRLDSSSSGNDSSDSSSSKTATTTGSVNMRASGSTAATKVGVYPKDTKVTVVEKGQSWSKVKIGNTTGYINNNYLKFA